MNKLMSLQSDLFILVSCLALILGYSLDLNANLFVLFIILGFIVLLGVPHGSLDVLFASQTYDLNRLTHWLKFLSYYTIAASGVILVWFVMPSFFFTSFLILSAVHFSDDLNSVNSKLFKLGYGLSIITFPSILFSAELINLYAMIVNVETATSLVTASHWISMPVGLILAVKLLDKRIAIRTKLEVLSVCALFVLLNPMLAFGVYFCVMHSARHLIRSHFFLSKFTKQAFLNALILPTIAVIIMGLFVWWIGTKKPIEVDMIRIVFIGLAALTVPHAWVLNKSNFHSSSIGYNSKDYD